MRTLCTRAFLLTLLSTLLFCVGLAVASQPVDVWQFRNPLPTINDLNNVIFLNGRFVAVGILGEVLASLDGRTWNRRQGAGDVSLYDVAYGNGLYVATGAATDGAAIFTSSDLTEWTRQSTPTTNILNALTYGNGLFVGVGQRGTIIISSDGTNWIQRASGTTNPLRSVSVGNGAFVTAGTDLSLVYVSSDGTTWSSYNVGFPSVSMVRFLNGRFFACGSRPVLGGQVPMITTSANGTVWAATTLGPSLPSRIAQIAYGQGLYVATFDGLAPYFFVSTDGHTFDVTTHTNFAGGTVAFGNNVFVGAGGARVGIAGRFLLQVSDDRTNWLATTTGPIPPLLGDIAHGNGMYVAVGSAYSFAAPGTAAVGPTIAVSPTALSFQEQAIPASGALSRIHFADGLFHSVGYNGTILRSTNGTVWLKRTSGVSGNLRAITQGNGLWVAAGDDGAVTTSSNGQAWTLRFSGTSFALNGITYGANLFVAVGYLGTVITSSDAINWTVQFTDTLETFFDIAYYDGQFVAVGTGGAIFTSSDTINWVARALGTTNELHAIAGGGGHFIATGFGSDSSGRKFNVVLSSTNAIDWTPQRVPTSLAMYGARYINDTLFLLGEAGVILQSLPLNPLELTGAWNRTQNQFEVTITCTAGQSFRVQSCDSFGADSWMDRAAFTNAASQVLFIDPMAATRSARFYRTVRD
jgi:hypothetical protein